MPIIYSLTEDEKKDFLDYARSRYIKNWAITHKRIVNELTCNRKYIFLRILIVSGIALILLMTALYKYTSLLDELINPNTDFFSHCLGFFFGSVLLAMILKVFVFVYGDRIYSAYVARINKKKKHIRLLFIIDRWNYIFKAKNTLKKFCVRVDIKNRGVNVLINNKITHVINLNTIKLVASLDNLFIYYYSDSITSKDFYLPIPCRYNKELIYTISLIKNQ